MSIKDNSKQDVDNALVQGNNIAQNQMRALYNLIKLFILPITLNKIFWGYLSYIPNSLALNSIMIKYAIMFFAY